MNKLEELIKETDYTQEEWNIHKKVERHNQLEEKEQYEVACNKAEIIQEKFDKWLDYDWQTTMKDAIDYVLEDKNDFTI